MKISLYIILVHDPKQPLPILKVDSEACSKLSSIRGAGVKRKEGAGVDGVARA